MNRVLFTSVSILLLSASQAIANPPSNLPPEVNSTSSPSQPSNRGLEPDREPSAANAMKMPKTMVSRPTGRDAYPAYCPSLPKGVTEADWLYREALHLCKYGT